MPYHAEMVLSVLETLVFKLGLDIFWAMLNLALLIPRGQKDFYPHACHILTERPSLASASPPCLQARPREVMTDNIAVEKHRSCFNMLRYFARITTSLLCRKQKQLYLSVGLNRLCDALEGKDDAPSRGGNVTSQLRAEHIGCPFIPAGVCSASASHSFMTQQRLYPGS